MSSMSKAQVPKGRASLPVGVKRGGRGGGVGFRGGSRSMSTAPAPAGNVKGVKKSTTGSALPSIPTKAEIPMSPTPPKFEWRVNEPNGYFELGTLSPDDDLYVMNITIVAAEYLHCLLRDEESYLRDTYLWSVTYNAFGCDISSDTFQLPHTNDARRAFIGDRATARIRTNGAMFNEYLTETSLEFQVLRSTAITGNDKLMGLSFLDLKELAEAGVNCLKCTLEIVPVGTMGSSTTRFRDKKPEVRVIIDMNVIPNYFAHHDAEDAGQVTGDSFVSKGTATVPKPPELVTIPSQDEDSSDSVLNIGDMDIFNHDQILDKNMGAKDEREKLNDQVTPLERSVISDHGRSGVGAGDEINPSKKSKDIPLSKDIEIITIHSPPPSPTHRTNTYGSSETEDQIIIPTGTYKVEIELREIRIKSRGPMTSDFQLSLTYPALGIPADSPVFCTIDKKSFRSPGNDSRKMAKIEKGTWQLIAQLGPESIKALREPIMIESSHGFEKQSSFALVKINFTDVFSVPILNNKRQYRNEADIIRKRDDAKIGCLLYSLRVQETSTIGQSSSDEEEDYASSAEESEFGPTPRLSQAPIAPPPPIPISPQQGIDSMDGQSGSKGVRNVETIENNWQSKIETVTKNDLQSWKNSEMARFRDDLKEKEKAYLRILAEEWSKRDEERDRQTAAALEQYEQRVKTVEKKSKRVEKMERELEQREMEVGNIIKQKNFENSKAVEDLKLRLRQAKAEYSSEIKSYLNRIEYLEAERDKFKSKVMTIEARLQSKEHEIEKLLNARAQWPDLQLERKLLAAEDKVEQLKEKLTQTAKERDNYKLYADKLTQRQNQLHHQRDQELQHENSNLRAQIFASQYKKDLLDERKTVEGISEQLKSLQTLYSRRDRKNGIAPTGILHAHFSPSPPKQQRNRKTRPRSYDGGPPASVPGDDESDENDNFNRTLDIKHLTPLFIKSMNEQELTSEIARVTKERNRMKDHGLNPTNPKLRELENLLTRLASQRQALQLQL